MFDDIFATYNQLKPPENYFEIQKPELMNPIAEDYNNNISVREIPTKEVAIEESNPVATLQTTQYPRTLRTVISNDKFKDKNLFLKTLNLTYREVLSEHGLDPNYSKILTASAAFESGYGTKTGGRFNYGGIKSKVGNSASTIDYVNGQYIRRNQTFRNFNSMKDYCTYVVKLLQNKRYNAFNQFDSNHPFELWTHVLNSGYGGGDAVGKKRYVDSLRKIYTKI